MRFELNKFNYKSLPQLAEALRQDKIKRMEIELTDEIEEIPRFSEMVPFLYRILDYEPFFEIWLKNIPFCAVNPGAVDHILPSDDGSSGEKAKECQNCLWQERCPGFPQGYLNKYGLEEICPMPDLPWEVMIEVTPRCNFSCHFCFNKISFAQKGRKIKPFTTDYLEKIINHLAQTGINTIRFTGGEPFLRKDIFELIKYAKNKNLEVRLNTNASLINKNNVKKLKGIVDNILIPIEGYSDEKESKITGYPHSLKKKIEVINLLKEEAIPVVRAGTVATKENINDFDKIAHLVSQLPLDEWELYRPIPISKKNGLDSKLINLLVRKLINLAKETEKAVFIANALPFCAIKDLNKMNSISKGALFDDGHTRLVIDPRGFVKPHYFMDEDIGQPLDILSAWHHPLVEKIRNLEYLPQECQACPFIFKCRGGSRQAAKLFFDRYDAADPLANLKQYGKSRH